MTARNSKNNFTVSLLVRSLYGFLAPQAVTAIIYAALFCILAVKFFHAVRVGMTGEYIGWISSDVIALLTTEIVLGVICFRWPVKTIIRITLVISAVVCTWSVINAAWIIRTGTQILPGTILPLIRDPLNGFSLVGINLVKMPAAAIALLGPSAVALVFFFTILSKPVQQYRSRKRLEVKILISLTVILAAVTAMLTVKYQVHSENIVSQTMRYNCHFKAVKSIFSASSANNRRYRSVQPSRQIPAFDQVVIAPPANNPNHTEQNIVIVILEGIQYRYTSLHDKDSDLTPFLAGLATEGAQFTNARSTLTHTTKAIFSLFTGRYPSVSQDIAEAVPAEKPYASLVTILKSELNFRTAFFQSAKGNFESRPGLAHNLGFDEFWTREQLDDPNAFIGYLACDEFEMLEPIVSWIKAGGKPFLLTVLCSVSHDPYEVPQWFARPDRELVPRYKQTIRYTDKFLAELDNELAKLKLSEKTIFCVVSDHGEAFGEHGLLGHERIPFDEVLHVPWVIRAPQLIEPATKVTEPVSSIDLTPTLLALLGFEDNCCGGFDGLDALGRLPAERKVYFSGWLRQSSAGFVTDNQKFIYDPVTGTGSVYDLQSDPLELSGDELAKQDTEGLIEQIESWRKNSVFRIKQQKSGQKKVFDKWLCRWNNRISSARYRPGN